MKLQSPIIPNQAQSMRGIVDFYYWRSIPVARAWPRSPRQPNSPAQLAARNYMRQANAWAAAAPVSWSDLWKAQPSIPGRSYRDQYIKALIKAQTFAPLPKPFALVSLALLPPDGILPQRLRIDLSASFSADATLWEVFARAQPPTDPAITHYDAGWYVNRCKALYRMYRPIWAGFEPQSLAPDSSPTRWLFDQPAPCDALSVAIRPRLIDNPPLDQTDCIYPPQIVVA